jgi:hypothetical protein
VAIADRATATSDTTGTSLTYAHSVSGSTDLAIWVYVDCFRSPTTSDPSGVTYAGAAMTKISNYAGGTGNDNFMSLWRRAAPSTGANNVVVTFSQSHEIVSSSISYSGVDQTTPNDTPVNNDVTVTNPSHSITSATGDMVVDATGWWGGTGATPSGAGTERVENANLTGVNSLSVQDAPGAASVSVGWTYEGAPPDRHGQIAFNINAAVVGNNYTRSVDGAQPASTGVLAGELFVPPPAQMWVTRPLYRPQPAQVR